MVKSIARKCNQSRNHQRILSKVSNETIVHYIVSIKQANLSDRDRIRSRLIHRQCTMITPRVILMTNQGKLRGVPRSKAIRFELIRPFIPSNIIFSFSFLTFYFFAEFNRVLIWLKFRSNLCICIFEIYLARITIKKRKKKKHWNCKDRFQIVHWTRIRFNYTGDFRFYMLLIYGTNSFFNPLLIYQINQISSFLVFVLYKSNNLQNEQSIYTHAHFLFLLSTCRK